MLDMALEFDEYQRVLLQQKRWQSQRSLIGTLTVYRVNVAKRSMNLSAKQKKGSASQVPSPWMTRLKHIVGEHDMTIDRSKLHEEEAERLDHAASSAHHAAAVALRRKHGEWVGLDLVSTVLPQMTGSHYAAAAFRHEPTAMATLARRQYLTALYQARRRFQSFLLLLDGGEDVWVKLNSAPYEISGMTELEANILAAGLRQRTFEVEVRPSTTKSSGERTLGRDEYETFSVFVTDPVLTLKL